MFAKTQVGGTDMAFPDVCLTPAPPAPPVPIPYPNIAMSSMAVKAAWNVLFNMAPAHNLKSTIPMSNGDNAGVGTGVASGTVMGSVRPITGAMTVMIGGAPAARMSGMTLQNGTNAVGATITPSQVKVLILAP